MRSLFRIQDESKPRHRVDLSVHISQGDLVIETDAGDPVARLCYDEFGGIHITAYDQRDGQTVVQKELGHA